MDADKEKKNKGKVSSCGKGKVYEGRNIKKIFYIFTFDIFLKLNIHSALKSRVLENFDDVTER